MKEIQRYSAGFNSVDKDSEGCFVSFASHLAAIEEVRKQERERMMKFAEWTSDGSEESFDYWQKNVEWK